MALCSLPPELILYLGKFLSDSSLNTLIKSQKLFARLLTPQLYNHQLTFPKEDIVERNPDASDDPDPFTCFDCAGRWHSDVILSYFRSRPIHALTHRCEIWGHTLLHIVTRTGNLVLAKILVSKGLDINAKDFDDRTPLFEAARGKKEEMMGFLLKAGADPTGVDLRGRTLLEETAAFGSGTMVQWLVDALKQIQCHGDQSVNSSVISQSTSDRSLHAAIRMNDDEHVARILLDYGANPSSADEDGDTALIASAHYAHEGIISMLLDRGADPLPYDDHGISAIGHANHSRCSWGVIQKLFQAVLDAGGDLSAVSPRARGPESLLSSADGGCLPAIKFLLSHKVITDIQYAANALHLALYSYQDDPISYEEVCRLLMNEINVADQELRQTLHVIKCFRGGGTSLHLAAQSGAEILMQLLLRTGVNAFVLDDKGRSALDIARLRGHDGIVKLLSEKENLN